MILLSQNFEIEFKNILSAEKYQEVFEKEFAKTPATKHKIIQTNYYFDTIETALKNQGAALRIRVTDSYQELTFKVPHNDFLTETNIPLTNEQVNEIIRLKQIILSLYVSAEDQLPDLENIDKETVFRLFNAFETKRFEKQVGEHLIVLDQTTFQNGSIDYELEVESTDATLGKEFFDQFLENHSIPVHPAAPKIARAQERAASDPYSK